MEGFADAATDMVCFFGRHDAEFDGGVPTAILADVFYIISDHFSLYWAAQRVWQQADLEPFQHARAVALQLQLANPATEIDKAAPRGRPLKAQSLIANSRGKNAWSHKMELSSEHC